MRLRSGALIATVLALAASASLVGRSAAAQIQSLQKIPIPGSPYSSPTFLTAPPGDPSRIFVVQEFGRIKLVYNGAPQQTPFLDITSLVSQSAEHGLLSMAFAPDYATSGKFYV